MDDPSARELQLSVVVPVRHDDRTGDPVRRLQIFVDAFEQQCRRVSLDAEVIVVEWGAPADRPRLATLIRWPVTRCTVYRFFGLPPGAIVGDPRTNRRT